MECSSRPVHRRENLGECASLVVEIEVPPQAASAANYVGSIRPNDLGNRSVAEAITGYAERSGADLIALTTRGRGGLSRLFRGSLAEAVARRSAVPVLLCRLGDPASAPQRAR